MKESEIKEQKLNLIDRFRKKWLIRKMQKTKKIDVYLKIRDSKIKYDREIMEVAWEFASKLEIREFTPVFQREKANGDYSILKYCDEQIQKEVTRQNKGVIQQCSEIVQIDIGRENSNNIKYCNERAQRSIAMRDNTLLSYCLPEIQKRMLTEEPKLIRYCNQEIKGEALANADSESPEWQTIVENSDWETLKKETRNQDNIKKRNIRVKWLNQSEQKAEDMIGMMDENDKEYIKYLKKDKQQQFFENRNLLEKYEIRGCCGDSENGLSRKCEMMFGKECIFENFKQRYGQEKYAQYEPLLEDLYLEPSKYPDETKRRILNMFFREETIVQKIEVEKIKRYLEEKDDQKVLFREIIGQAYGEEALKILEERDGLDLENIDNTEVFLPQILDNFREGFVQDLLSYEFERIDDFIKIVKSPEDLKAFKFYYDRMSSNLGENAVTMQMCMERYGEYSDILKEASEVKLNEQQMTKIEQLCSWRRNIAGITKIEELPQLEEKMKKVLLEQELEIKARGEGTLPTSERLFGDDILLKEIDNEAKIYDLYNLTEEEMQELTEQERETMQLLQSEGSIGTDSLMDKLLKAINGNIPIVPIFLDTYKAINKVKENGMKKFRGEVTDKEKIETAIREGKDDVKKLVVDGVEVIDLGNMKTNFAIHTLYRHDSMSFSPNDKDVPKIKEYVTYDKRQGMSTISAEPKMEKVMKEEEQYGLYRYVYWDFSDNEVVGLAIGEEGSDAHVSHAPRRIKPKANSKKIPLKRYTECKKGMEIAFFRRYRSHPRIEKEGYGGKVMPSAILGDPTNPLIVKIAQERFGKKIPILCKRGMLQEEEKIESIIEAIKVANGEKEFKSSIIGLRKLYEEEGIRLGEIQEQATLVRNIQQKENHRETGEKEENDK